MIPAEDFFNALFAGGYADRFDWKARNEQTAFYEVHVVCKKCEPLCYHTFNVRVINGIHFVKKTSAINFSKRHRIPQR